MTKQLWHQIKHHPLGTLMRLNKPVGTLLLLWPTSWALWLASLGQPSFKHILLFSSGVVVMRAAGCVINDYWDRDLDGQVARTQARPLATGQLTAIQALMTFVLLVSLGACVAFALGWQVFCWSIVGLFLAIIYPLMKRITHWPQVILALAFNWGIILAFIAVRGEVTLLGWWLFFIAAQWTVMYDTAYAMVDREDDLSSGIKSTAVILGRHDRLFMAVLQIVIIIQLFLLEYYARLGTIFLLSVGLASGLFIYQQYLMRDRLPEHCFRAFLNNQWVGYVLFSGFYFSDYTSMLLK